MVYYEMLWFTLLTVIWGKKCLTLASSSAAASLARGRQSPSCYRTRLMARSLGAAAARRVECAIDPTGWLTG